jgi:signal transduction histidine kinase/ActR/RegA family two-component response regulator
MAIPPNDRSGGPMVALLERKTTLFILAVGSACCAAIYVFETLARTITPLDRYLEPCLAVSLALLVLWLWRSPGRLLWVQRSAVGLVQAYFAVVALHLAVVQPTAIDVYWASSSFQWMTLVCLLLHITWSRRAALYWSVSMLLVLSVPVLAVRAHIPEALWREQFLPITINAALVQLAMVVGLRGIWRTRHSVANVLSTHGTEGPDDARAALSAWMQQQTTELADARDRAELASRAKSQFVAVMSHELRTPLHAIMVSADLLEQADAAASPGREQRLIQTIRNSGKHLMTLIDQVLDLSRIEAGKLEIQNEPLDLGQVADKALQAVSPMAADKHLQLECVMHPRLQRMRSGDSLRLTQILINLLANACKFTERGHVRLRVTPGEHTLVSFEVEDSGIGMSAAVQQRVFEAFYQADHDSTRRHGGVGLGLTITRDLVRLMGGSMHLSSAAGQGTRVRLDIPLAELARQPTETSTSLPHDATLLHNMRVLVVEDDPVNSMLACEILKLAGALTDAADSGEVAMDHLARSPVDLVLMDYRMPGMDGIETTRRIRDGQAGPEARTTPIVGLTANAYEEDRQACLAAGMNEVLTKPLDRQALIRALSKWHLERQP